MGTYVFTVGTPPQITNYSPGFGMQGTVVTIHGAGFGKPTESSELYTLSAVTNGWVQWKPTSWSDTEIVVTVPTTMPLGKVYLVVERDGVQSAGWYPFTVGIPPSIAGYSPTSGPSGTALKIHGTGFGTTQNASSVSVQSAAVYTWREWPATGWSNTDIEVPVPTTAPPGKVYINLVVNKLQSIGTYPFTVGTPPVISEYSPGFGLPGTVVTIHGTGFGLTQGSNFVSALSVATKALAQWVVRGWNDTDIVVSVPENTPRGLTYIAVTADGLEGIGTDPFTVGIPPAIANYIPGFGSPGTPVTIRGTGFGATQGGSSVAALSATTNAWTTWTPTLWSDSQIVVPVPTTEVGKVYLYVNVDGLASIGTYPFAVGTPPAIADYTPFFGSPGTAVTIRGTGFGATQGSSSVGALSATTNAWTTWTPTLWSDSQIVVPVPTTGLGRAYLYVSVGGLSSIGTYPFDIQ